MNNHYFGVDLKFFLVDQLPYMIDWNTEVKDRDYVKYTDYHKQNSQNSFSNIMTPRDNVNTNEVIRNPSQKRSYDVENHPYPELNSVWFDNALRKRKIIKHEWNDSHHVEVLVRKHPVCNV